MERPHICAVITKEDTISIQRVEPIADLFEVRIDLIGKGWTGLACSLKKPWIATNRLPTEGGKWAGAEDARQQELLKALKLGAALVDIELSTPNLEEVVPVIKKKAKCLISSHNMRRTPPPRELCRTVEDELAAGADVCKVVAAARSFDDNITLLNLINEFPGSEVVAFAMGPRGQMSRIFCSLAGGAFTYAAISEGDESAAGQLTVSQLRQIYETLRL
jgi:3-dehydroquinate dehydratase-1